ncbi:unnamed protein product [Zymoseptoria tritici ST99CH_1A5]|uniref:Uncharacterized protein n=4 Tax=Zymoseptoria tritici TaxID=1047171 RepID=F9XCK1_ZYMTI|nr:uncharacterized protein MYCGRDRAFT_104538 [Zymoseptoria tritici IPO323]SMQ50895.1 unnamed protein product [Zymoseptoria tritici ST99CH_3D7]SMR52813.1 unnamed protein product [Zymoseptoria tritici ST99CH_1E4]SMR54161.1 unnamed protein product [Zymoseptoria tritici ST99CH_3D1]SMY24557.1 unnamed protein product [Zymoseptoria tritici ST99CH_1A5]EGP87191.1 hypothetical protein MYCGRDRAFT_104538 [Zymoseptoria tritici IPO323]
MSLLRSFTTRLNKTETTVNDAPLGRAASQRNGKPIYRSQISSPLSLVSTTNMLSYNAPNIDGTSPISHREVSSSNTTSSAASSDGEHSDASTMDIHTDTDASSIDECNSPGPEPNHLSCYFKPAVDTRSSNASSKTSFDAPTIPQRVPSHSKKAHESIHRKRSVQRMMSPPASIVRMSSEMFSPVSTIEETNEHNPFSNELAQLDEAVEDLSTAAQDVETQEDIACMTSLDLAQFCASEYLAEIHGLTSSPAMASEQLIWI